MMTPAERIAAKTRASIAAAKESQARLLEYQQRAREAARNKHGGRRPMSSNPNAVAMIAGLLAMGASNRRL